MSGGGWTAAKGPQGDSWSAFLHERNALFDELTRRRITGVVLLSGDTHYGELNLIPRTGDGAYDLYELVSSPLAQIPNSTTRQLTGDESRLRPAYNLAPNVGFVDFDTTAADPTITLGLVNVLGRYAWEPLHLKLSQLGGPAPSPK
jgi:alkaline phosphatase D